MANCGPCFNLNVPACAVQWKVNANLEADTDYIAQFTDKFGNKYSVDVTTDALGAFTINPEGPTFPDGLFNGNAGSFNLEVFQELGCAAQTMTFCEEVFTCVAFTMYNSAPMALYNLGCCGDVSVSPLPCVGNAPQVLVGSNSPVCAGSTLTLTVEYPFGGGVGDSYRWTGPEGFESTTQNPNINSIEREAEGVYTVEITSPGNCITTTQINVAVNIPISSLEQDSVTPATIGNSDGGFTVHANGGTGPYTYATNSGAIVNADGIFTGLPAGDYLVHVDDSNGCTTADINITITES